MSKKPKVDAGVLFAVVVVVIAILIIIIIITMD
jgi:hypothetical protein